jgi:hypothetical protein
MSVSNSKTTTLIIMPPINGRFYFKQTTNENLIGEFSNHQSSDIYTESADLIGSANGYMGEYYSTWRENVNPRFANLTIKPGRTNKLFTLEWKQNGILTFIGEGMLCDKILIGDYESVP